MRILKEYWQKMFKQGIAVPYFYDPVTKRASITIMFPYITFLLAVASVIGLHFDPKMLMPTAVTLSFWGVSVIFYLLRQLTKAKVNFKERSFELDSGLGSDSSDPEDTIGS